MAALQVLPSASHVAHPSPATRGSGSRNILSKMFGCGCFSSHQQQQNRTQASRPVTPISTEYEQVAAAAIGQRPFLTPLEQMRSEDKTSGRELFCPICMYYASQVLTMQCCGHSVCLVCTSEYFSCHALRFSPSDASISAPLLPCMHCATPSFNATCITQGGRAYEDSPAALKQQLRQKNRMAMSGSGSITLPSPLKRGDGFDALAAKLVRLFVLLLDSKKFITRKLKFLQDDTVYNHLTSLQVSYEQHAIMIRQIGTQSDTPNSDNNIFDSSNTSGRTSPVFVPTLLPAPTARSAPSPAHSDKNESVAYTGVDSAVGGLDGRLRPNSAGKPPIHPSMQRSVLPDSGDLQSAELNASPSSSNYVAVAESLVAAAGGIDDVRASVSMIRPILAEVDDRESDEVGARQMVDEQFGSPTLNVPLP